VEVCSFIRGNLLPLLDGIYWAVPNHLQIFLGE